MELNDGEMNRCAKVWLTAIASSCYCYGLDKAIQKGFVRFLFVLPVIYLFTILPFFYLTSYHLGGITWFFLSWLGTFKLLLFSFGHGPLTTPIHPDKPLSLAQFLCVCLLPIKVKQDRVDRNNRPIQENPDLKKVVDPVSSQNGNISIFSRSAIFAIKMVILATITKLYEYTQDLPTVAVLALYCCHVYLGVETALAGAAVLVRATLKVELEPQFNNPYLSTSLQDFWGRRWNLMVPDILRATVYSPIRHFCSPLTGKQLAMAFGTLASFTVSGLMHEWIYYYLTHVSPTWEVTFFFLLHGLCTAIEVKVKNAVQWRLHPVISAPLTIAFIVSTAKWLFFPQLLRNEVIPKVLNEYVIIGDFVTSYFSF